jgi:hypothetical protein
MIKIAKCPKGMNTNVCHVLQARPSKHKKISEVAWNIRTAVLQLLLRIQTHFISDVKGFLLTFNGMNNEIKLLLTFYPPSLPPPCVFSFLLTKLMHCGIVIFLMLPLLKSLSVYALPNCGSEWNRRSLCPWDESTLQQQTRAQRDLLRLLPVLACGEVSTQCDTSPPSTLILLYASSLFHSEGGDRDGAPTRILAHWLHRQ